MKFVTYKNPQKEIVSHAFEHLIYNLKMYNVLWDSQKGNSFPYIWILNPQYQVIQQSQDINSVGT